MQERSVNGSDYVTALYIRLSQEDRDISFQQDKTESNSITNQRALLWEYVRSHEELAGSTVIEKCDDGYSGVKFDNRPQFAELIRLAKEGKVNCIIVKDFSRFGRDYVELGDYLEQFFPFLGIRFISINDGYDSSQFDGTTGGLDVAFKNMIYDFYSREFSKKQKIAWRHMAEKGEYNAHCALYGYKKSEGNIHKLAIHEETGKIVREIFEMMASGISPRKIARILNQRGIPAPSKFHDMEGFRRQWSRYGAECFWTDDRVRRMVKDERYTGTMVSLKTDAVTVKGKRRKKPPSDWVRVEGTHEPIVPYELFVKANSMLKQCEFKAGGRKERNIYFCGYCGRMLGGDSRGNILCGQRYFRQECDCRGAKIRKADADSAVLEAVRGQIKMEAESEKLSKSAKSRAVICPEQEELKTLERTADAMKRAWMPLYEQYTDGKLSREEFLLEKKKHEEETDRIEQRIGELKKKQEMRSESSRKKKERKDQLYVFADQMELTEEVKEKLIDKVKVYADNRIEICWKFEAGFSDMETIHRCG